MAGTKASSGPTAGLKQQSLPLAALDFQLKFMTLTSQPAVAVSGAVLSELVAAGAFSELQVREWCTGP